VSVEETHRSIKKTIAEFTERIRVEDSLFNSRTAHFVMTSGILVAAFGWSKDDLPVCVGIIVLGLLVAVDCGRSLEAHARALRTARRHLA